MSDYALSHEGSHFSDPGIRAGWVGGAAAGNLTLTGIEAQDKILSVYSLDTDATPPTETDLTSEFSVTADDTINNTGGTATTGTLVHVMWLKVHPNS